MLLHYFKVQHFWYLALNYCIKNDKECVLSAKPDLYTTKYFFSRNGAATTMTPLSKLKLRGDAPETPKSVRKRISKKIEQKLESSSSEEEESDEEEANSEDEDIKPIDKPAANRTGCVLTSSFFRV